jgi:hypothetical protein
VSGRRFYTRFQQGSPSEGLIQVLRDVSVQYDEFSGALTILSETPGVIGEELTLAVVSADGDAELRVEIVASRPEIVSGLLRHRLQLRPTGRDGVAVRSAIDGSSEQ